MFDGLPPGSHLRGARRAGRAATAVNEPLKCGQGEVCENLSASRVNLYEIVGMGNPHFDPALGMRYHDYDTVPDTMMHDQMLAKGKAKFRLQVSVGW